jgi:hypothetical protein
MVTRPGASPIPEWMEKMNEFMRDPLQFNRTFRKYVLIFAALWVGSIIFGDIVVYRAHGRHVGGYTSPVRVGGLQARITPF